MRPITDHGSHMGPSWDPTATWQVLGNALSAEWRAPADADANDAADEHEPPITLSAEGPTCMPLA